MWVWLSFHLIEVVPLKVCTQLSLLNARHWIVSIWTKKTDFGRAYLEKREYFSNDVILLPLIWHFVEFHVNRKPQVFITWRNVVVQNNLESSNRFKVQFLVVTEPRFPQEAFGRKVYFTSALLVKKETFGCMFHSRELFFLALNSRGSGHRYELWLMTTNMISIFHCLLQSRSCPSKHRTNSIR